MLPIQLLIPPNSKKLECSLFMYRDATPLNTTDAPEPGPVALLQLQHYHHINRAYSPPRPTKPRDYPHNPSTRLTTRSTNRPPDARELRNPHQIQTTETYGQQQQQRRSPDRGRATHLTSARGSRPTSRRAGRRCQRRRRRRRPLPRRPSSPPPPSGGAWPRAPAAWRGPGVAGQESRGVVQSGGARAGG